MKSKTLPIFLIISLIFLGGCSMFSPFKSINTCKNVKGNGAPCASVESNLEYSIEKDNPADIAAPEKDNKKSAKDTEEISQTDEITAPHMEEDVIKDEIARIMAEMSVDANVTKKPVLIPSQTYRALIFPYSAGDRFYSARYVYITAGKPRWAVGNYVFSEKKPIKIDVPQGNSLKKSDKEVISQIPLSRRVQSENETVSSGGEKYAVNGPASHFLGEKYKVRAYLLNCRDTPSVEGDSIAVFERDRVLDIVDKSLSWWKVSFYETECYVNPKYLYNEEPSE